MSNIISDSVSKLSAITDQTPIDWDAFDSVLKGLENINAYDEHYEETILSEFIMDGEFYKRGFILADVVRHFLACGYDVSANDGLNGGLALHSLCWSSYDHYVLEAAKVLMNAGAPVKYRTSGDDPNEEPEGLLGSISWKLSGAWMVDKDYAWANTLEAYYAMTEANIAGKDYNAIDNYFACIGKPLTAVSAINVGGKPALYDEGAVSVYSEPLILWFENKPLVVSCYTDFVVNPVYADDKKNDLADVTTAFSSLIGTTLKEVQYIGTAICYFEFSNGKRLFFASRNIGDGKRVGTFDILADSKKVNVEQLCIESFCAISDRTFASTVTEYSEDAIPSSVMMQHTFSTSVLEQPTDTSLVFALVPRNCLLNTHVSIHYSNRPKPHGFMIKIICPQYALISQRDTCIWWLQNIMTSKSSFRIKFIILCITMFCLAKRANTWNS